MLRRTEVNTLRGMYQGSLLIILERFKVSRREFFTNLLQNQNEVIDFSQDKPKIIEHSGYLTRYCEISLPICSRGGSLSNDGPF